MKVVRRSGKSENLKAIIENANRAKQMNGEIQVHVSHTTMFIDEMNLTKKLNKNKTACYHNLKWKGKPNKNSCNEYR